MRTCEANGPRATDKTLDELAVDMTEGTPGERKTMTCAEVQKELPYIIDGGGSIEQEEHLKTCKVCADLVADLRYIAEQAKLLVPMQDPSPRVWDSIIRSLERDGLVKPAQARRSLLGPNLC